MSVPIRIWQQPQAEAIAADISGFLHQLGGPTCITLQGRDQKRWRAVTTLLHGNEPSGILAIRQLLSEGLVPAVNTLIFIASVQAASTPPVFNHRTLPERRDLNRCFREPFTDEQGALAKAWIALLRQYRPEAMVDIHNTSGAGPAFAVATHEDDKHDALASLFTHRMIVTDLRMGSLMELSDNLVPTVTIECGGAQEETSHQVALEGLRHYLELPDVFAPETEWPIELLHHPVRLELPDTATVIYQNTPEPGFDVTLLPHIERYNFGTITPEHALGWLGPKGLEALRCKRTNGESVLHDFFEQRDEQLYPRKALKLFMVTTRADIAKSDCILYAVEA